MYVMDRLTDYKNSIKRILGENMKVREGLISLFNYSRKDDLFE